MTIQNNAAKIGGLIRHIVGAVGAALVYANVITADDAASGTAALDTNWPLIEQGLGAVALLGAALWSWFSPAKTKGEGDPK